MFFLRTERKVAKASAVLEGGSCPVQSLIPDSLRLSIFTSYIGSKQEFEGHDGVLVRRRTASAHESADVKQTTPSAEAWSRF